jgi:acyl dehydratase
MATQALTSAPALAPMYLKAAVTGPLHRGADLPESAYSLPDQRIDPDHLAAYQRVCGFGVSDVLPPTYLHVLAFPLSVALMTEAEFPFPLVGMVHVANAITVVRPVRADEAVTFDVRAADLRDHPAGRQFDLLAEASVDGETVWRGRSTYLRREKRSDRDRTDKPRRTEPDSAEFAGAAARVRVPDDIGRRYAAVSGDRNPIHLHALTARLFGFPSAIAHGMWVKARTVATLQGRLPDAYTVEVAFKLPVRLPSTIAIASDRTSAGWALQVRHAGSGKPHLTGSIAAGAPA